MPTALVNGRVLIDGPARRRPGRGDRGEAIVDAIVRRRRLSRPGWRATTSTGGLLAPGFIDTQVNGGGGVLFNDAPTVETIAAIGAAHRRFGTTGFLPTLISDDLEHGATERCAVDEAIAAACPGVLGIHIEGPFLNVPPQGHP
jgi:N-acetylglucosamine-6-phosphate deacetylase